MRISDWSSDVCSSDLHMGMLVVLELLPPLGRRISETVSLVLVGGFALGMIWYGGHLAIVTAHDNIPSVDLPQGVFYAALPLSGAAIVLFVIERLLAAALARKSVVSGKRVSGRVDIGVRRIINKNKKTHKQDTS